MLVFFTLRISQDLKALVGTGDPSQNKFPSFLGGVQWMILRVTNNGMISVPIGSMYHIFILLQIYHTFTMKINHSNASVNIPFVPWENRHGV